MAENEAVEVVASTLEATATWAVAVVCFVLISISILIEHLFHLSFKFLGRRRKSLNQALYKIKSELMLLGFISLALTMSQGSISKICVPDSFSESFLPCQNKTNLPSAIEEETTCKREGKVALMSKDSVDQLQMLIFTLGLFHVISCIFTFALGMAKMKKWKTWEEETRTLEYQLTNDPRRFRLTHQTSFARRHSKFWSNHRILRWPACFIRQFYGSVSKTDYFILRHGFIVAHFAEASKFDFQKFLSRALDEDFQVVVGMSLWVWIFSVFFIYFNAYVFRAHFWLPFIPLVILLLVGTNLQAIITTMCLESRDSSTVVRGTFLVKPSDNLFWFSRPDLLLFLMHFILFQNSFQLAFFSWTWYKFGLRSCFHRKTVDIILEILVAMLVQFLCGYVTLPLYALVTQMGSSMKKAVFTEKVIRGLKHWHTIAKRKVVESKTSSSTARSPRTSPSYAILASPKEEEGESEILEIDHTPPAITGGPRSVESLMEVEMIEGNKKMQNTYNGEVSFNWRVEEKELN